MTPGEKVALFGRIFRDRSDVYACLWLNARKGTKGYAPACTNEWVPGLCEKPRAKCGDCANPAFLPAGERAIYDHLQGRHVMGLYPLLKDETCWLLAVDFDRDSWVDDVSAFVAAATARSMGSFLITEAMSSRHELGLHSYDRQFPNQHTLPQGAFDHLIALPLQRGPRTKGSTVFIDDRFNPNADQWAYLSSLRRLPSETLERLVNNAVRSDLVAGVHINQSGEEADTPPWEIPQSGRTLKRRLQVPLPPAVRAVLAQRVSAASPGPVESLDSLGPQPVAQSVVVVLHPGEEHARGLSRAGIRLLPRPDPVAEQVPDELSETPPEVVDLLDLLEAPGDEHLQESASPLRLAD